MAVTVTVTFKSGGDRTPPSQYGVMPMKSLAKHLVTSKERRAELESVGVVRGIGQHSECTEVLTRIVDRRNDAIGG